MAEHGSRRERPAPGVARAAAAGDRVAVVGAGSWGTAFAILAAERGEPVSLWARRTELAQRLQKERVTAEYLPGLALPPSLAVTADLEEALDRAAVVVTAVPTHAMRSVALEGAPHIARDVPVLNLSKGVEQGSLETMSALLSEALGRVDAAGIAVLSGPNHAEEVSRRVPSATVIASHDKDLAKALQLRFMRDYFRVYTNEDMIGVENAAATKNVIAIAAGACDGLGFGDNTKASLVTRGLAEMTRFGVKQGAQPLTYLGLAGVGDLVATCTSRHSRNRAVGEWLAKGKSADEIVAEMRMVAEGIRTAPAVAQLAEKLGVDVPITREVARALEARVDLGAAVRSLMTRTAADEMREMG
jgi:glycerol-3-phosphate dehydrogenase (NAD(P)+)